MNDFFRAYWKRILLVLMLVAAALLIRMTGWHEYITLQNLQAYAGSLQERVQDSYLQSVLLFIGIYILVTGFSIPGAAVMTLAGGYLFGVILGALYVNVGATMGAFLAFLAARFILGNWIHERYGDRLARFNREIHENGYSYLLTLRLIPIFPFFMINFFAGLTAIPSRTFLWTTSLGIIPGSLVYAFAGRQLATVTSVGDIFSINMLAAFVLLGLFALLPVVLKKLGVVRVPDMEEK
jgi:uncharacterized membrane protein YdjX (TVP38/TMEM64 family)